MSATQPFSLDEVVDALRGLFDVACDESAVYVYPAGIRFYAALDKARAVLAKVGG